MDGLNFIFSNNDVKVIGLNHLCYRAPPISSSGIWLGDFPLLYSVPLLFAQIALIFIVTRFTHAILKHLGQPQVVSYLIAGILLGPSGLGRNQAFTDLVFPVRSWVHINMISYLAFLLFIFVIGVKTDLGIIQNSGRKAVIIAQLSTFLPIIVTVIVATFLPHGQLSYTLLAIVMGRWAITSNIVVACLLAEFKLLTSKLGRFALSTSLIGDLETMVLKALVIGIASTYPDFSGRLLLPSFAAFLAFLGFIYLVARPTILWFIHRTPEGESLDEGHLVMVLLLAMVCGLGGEFIGQHAASGPLLLGLLLPGGAPLGTTLVERIDRLASELFLPLTVVTAGLRTNVFELVDPRQWGFVATLIGTSVATKFAAVVVPCLWCKMPLRDAVILGLMLNCRGIVELDSFKMWQTQQMLSNQIYTTHILGVVAVAGTTAGILKHLYKPSTRFLAHKHRTVQHSHPNGELRILACIHQELDVPLFAALLDAANPTLDSPIATYLLHLTPMAGRTNTVLVPYKKKQHKNPSSSSSLKSFTVVPSTASTLTDRIVNAFCFLEQNNPGGLSIVPFVGISPYASMHDDICSLAFDKKLALIILPFHKPADAGGGDSATRLVNTNVLRYAPCSVAILVGHGLSAEDVAGISRVAVYFFGGGDDREALAVAARMVGNPTVALSVVRFLSAEGEASGEEERMDDEAVDEFRAMSMDNKRVAYREKVVKDGAATVEVLREMSGDGHDLLVVGRRQGKESAMTSGLEVWSEYPELGVIGDLLASTEYGGRVTLVVQQQVRVRAGGCKVHPGEPQQGLFLVDGGHGWETMS